MDPFVRVDEAGEQAAAETPDNSERKARASHYGPRPLTGRRRH
jgi:hypothetical protein